MCAMRVSSDIRVSGRQLSSGRRSHEHGSAPVTRWCRLCAVGAAPACLHGRTTACGRWSPCWGVSTAALGVWAQLHLVLTMPILCLQRENARSPPVLMFAVVLHVCLCVVCVKLWGCEHVCTWPTACCKQFKYTPTYACGMVFFYVFTDYFTDLLNN